MTSDEESDDLCGKKKKTFKVCKHAIGEVSGDSGWTGKLGIDLLLDFIIFIFFTHRQSLHFGEITKTWKKN